MDLERAIASRRARGLLVVTSIVAYGAIYSALSVMRFYSFNAYVYDLGLSSELLYGAVHGGVLYFIQSPAGITANKMIYLPIALIFQSYPNFIPLVIFQAFWVALGAYPLYRISVKVLGDSMVSIVPPALYLLYFPLTGTVWFDFHFTALFPTFFFFGFLLYLADKRFVSIIMLFFAAVTNYLGAGIVFIFGLLIIRNDLGEGGRIRSKPYVISLLVFPLIIAVVVNLHFGTAYTLSVSNLYGFPYSLFTNLWLKILFIFSILSPLFLLSFYSPKYLILSLPYLVYMLFQGPHIPYYLAYGYQYAALYSPGIFLSFIYGLKGYRRYAISKSSLKKFRRSVVIVVIVNLVLVLLLTPVGNALTGSSFPYNTRQNVTYTPQDAALASMISMIPPGSSVLIQGNMPQLVVGYNWIVGYEFNGSNYPQYAINDPYEHLFNNTANVFLYNSSMEVKVFNELLNSGKYGIVSEQYGIMLLRENYTGRTIFKPQQYSKHSVSIVPSQPGQYAMTWQQNFIAPGIYNVTVQIGGTIQAPAHLFVTSANGSTTVIPMSSWSNYSGQFQSCMFDQGTSYGLDPQFSIVWNTTLQQESISLYLTQIAPQL